MDVLKPLIASKLLSSSGAVDVLSSVLLSSVGRPLDLLYSRLGGLNGRFFPTGWGNLGIVNLQEDIDLIKNWPPQDMQINWKIMQQGNIEGVGYKLYEGSFRTPCINRIYDALPPESRNGRVQLLMPAGGLSSTTAAAAAGVHPLFDQQHTSAAVLHLAATGDHGFSRRLKLGSPLLKQGVCQLVHESPYYGARRPAEQKGSKLCAVSDLLALGWATIYESLCLLHWLEQEGVEQRGICGLSMGGVHAAMTAGLYPKPLAIAPLLTPRSAAVAYCDGALAPLMSWRALLTEKDWADNEVERVVAAAAQKVSLLHEARYVKRLEQQLDIVQESLDQLQQPQQQPSYQQQQQQQHCWQEHSRQQQQQSQQHWQGRAQHERQQIAQQQQQQQETMQERQQADEDVAAVQTAAALAAVAEAAAAEAMDEQQQQQQDAGGSSDSSRNSSNLHIEVMDGAVNTSSTEANSSSWKREVRRRQAAAAGLSAITDLASPPTPHPDTFRRLRHVLETYTDVTRYPCPVRPDAAVLVAARDDGYVDKASVEALQAHWPGSELRYVSGGHVSAFLMHQDAFRAALRDSLVRLAERPAAAATNQAGSAGSTRAQAAA